MTYEQIPGWFDFGPLYDDMVRRARREGVFVEVGAYLGRSTVYLASAVQRSRKRIRLYVIDLWDGWFYDGYRAQTPMPDAAEVYWQFLRNMHSCGVGHCVCPLKLPSERATGLFADGSVDFVYLDGDHGREAMRRDLDAWFPKVRPGGFLGGHDYLNDDFPGARRAVDDFCSEHGLPLRSFPGPAGGSFLLGKPGPGRLARAVRKARRLLSPLIGSSK